MKKQNNKSALDAAPWLASLCLWSALPLAALAQTQNTTYQYEYDAMGNRTRITDPLGNVTLQRYDALNRLAGVTDAANGITQYGYDGLDHLSQVTDPRSQVTSYQVDGLGNLTKQQSPDIGAASNTYDAAGNLLTHTDAKGNTTSYQYDALNRVTRIAYADGNTIQFAYDQGTNALGHLTQITDASGVTQYSYDQHGRVLSETRSIANVGYTTQYAYDSSGRLASITYPSGRVVTYTRDAAGRISQIDASKGSVTQTVVSQVAYQPFGAVQSFVNGAGQTVTRGFDLDGRITRYSLRGQPQLVTYDAASRITSIWDTSNANNLNSYGYDNLDRLIKFNANATGANQSFGYDAVGNRTSQLLGSGSYSYNYSSLSNQLTQVSGPVATQIYSYDANGSITNNGGSQFNYDARGRLVSANTPLGLVQYRINALGQRVQKITATDSTVYHYDLNGQLIGESNAQSGKDYIYLNEIPVAVFQ